MPARWRYRPVTGLLTDRDEGWGMAQKLCGVALVWRYILRGAACVLLIARCTVLGVAAGILLAGVPKQAPDPSPITPPTK